MMKWLSRLVDYVISLVDIVDLVLKEHDSLLSLLSICELLYHFMHFSQPCIEVLYDMVELQGIDFIADLCF